MSGRVADCQTEEPVVTGACPDSAVHRVLLAGQRRGVLARNASASALVRVSEMIHAPAQPFARQAQDASGHLP